jgi:hypothetical protein
MSEPDSTPRRRPPTIDLTATEVASEKPSSATDRAGETTTEEPTPNGRSGSNFPGRLLPSAIGAAAGAIVMATIVLGLWLAGLVPAPNGPQASNGGTADQISAQLDKIQAELQARPPEAALASHLAAIEAQTKALGDSLAALNRRADDIAVTARDALTRANAAASVADAAKNTAQAGIQPGDIAALTNRIAALEREARVLADEVARRASTADDRAARSAIAAEALRAVVERGVPYGAELSAVKSLGADRNATGPLEQFAADGVPSASALAHELSLLTPTLLQASGTAEAGGSFLDRLENNAQRLVRITPIDAPESNEPAAVIARIKADVAHADIDGALADVARLPEAAKTLAEPWVKKAEARTAAIAAGRRVAADAMAALDKPNTQ